MTTKLLSLVPCLPHLKTKCLVTWLCGVVFLGLLAGSASAAKSGLYWPGGTKLSATVTDGGFIYVTWPDAVGSVDYYVVTASLKGMGEFSTTTVLPSDASLNSIYIAASTSGTVTIAVTAYDEENGTVVDSATLKTRVQYSAPLLFP